MHIHIALSLLFSFLLSIGSSRFRHRLVTLALSSQNGTSSIHTLSSVMASPPPSNLLRHIVSKVALNVSCH